MYYIPMAQPKTPPLSFRPPADVLEAVDLWAGKRGLARNAALIALLRLGLDAPERVKVDLPVGTDRPAYRSRLKKR